MGFDERLGYLLLGCVIGFIVGYILRSLRDIKKELDEVEEIVRKDHNEGGFMRFPIVADVALLLVIGMVVWASFSSQHASNEVENTQNAIEKITDCNLEYLTETVGGLNERTTSTKARADANVELQRAQVRFLGILAKKPPVSQEAREKALQEYVVALTEFVESNGDYADVAKQYPYPTKQDIEECLESER